jgi:signal transduction histidine kinase
VKRLDSIVGVANHTVLVRKDGTELNIADSGAPIRDQKGETTGIVLVFRDITMERKTQDALIANEKLAVAGRLAATIAHEIHNPLDSVSNLLYLMRNGSSKEESRQFMDMAEQELARVTQISRAMLGLYRESKAPVVVDLKEMLQEILLLLERRLIDLGVTITADMPASVSVAAFPAELRQVFTNLITNAAEATSPGGEVDVSLRAHNASTGAEGQKIQPGATVTIADNGPGIPEEVKPHLFQAFFTTKGEQGTGLGLWVSRGIIVKHGGTISVRSDTSNAEHGTVVSVFLATNPTINAGVV